MQIPVEIGVEQPLDSFGVTVKSSQTNHYQTKQTDRQKRSPALQIVPEQMGFYSPLVIRIDDNST